MRGKSFLFQLGQFKSTFHILLHSCGISTLFSSYPLQNPIKNIIKSPT
ncbi:hypothetical protein LX99_04229 [Mucilaginibacter oryzae]|uniref:Uncharacterized protein n=1 Tax=Mucilaginibacter oryzae TaxID=468058 RepID=A0A316H2E3_9SPHI|nr:hypothetical protein LX99_04229 [Mucilaginibacter oryzae]